MTKQEFGFLFDPDLEERIREGHPHNYRLGYNANDALVVVGRGSGVVIPLDAIQSVEPTDDGPPSAMAGVQPLENGVWLNTSHRNLVVLTLTREFTYPLGDTAYPVRQLVFSPK